MADTRSDTVNLHSVPGAAEPLVRPFRAIRVAKGRAAEVAAPPYDVLSSDEAREAAAGKEWSFLHVSKAEIDLQAGTDAMSDAVYDRAGANMRRMLDAGVLRRDTAPSYYVYRVAMGGHVQTGIAAAGSVAAYNANRIRKHEYTRPDKETDRVRQIEAVRAHTGPVMTVHKESAALAEIVAAVTTAEPDADVAWDGGIRHTIWAVSEPARVAAISEAFGAMDAIYIADGHHRSAAAARVAESMAAANPNHRGDEPYNFLLVVSFPQNELKILDYNRVVRDLNGLTPAQLLERAGAAFDVSPSDVPYRPKAPHEFGAFVGGRWHRLAYKGTLAANDPLAVLDVNILSKNLLEPVLGIGDARTDRRIDFVGGIRGLEGLEKRVRGGEMAAAFSLYPTRISDLIAVADAGLIMPPKSTWFEPKLADGLISAPLD